MHTPIAARPQNAALLGSATPLSRAMQSRAAVVMALMLMPLGAVIASPTASTPRHSPQPLATPDKVGTRPFVFPRMPSAFITLRPTTTVDLFDPADLAPPGTGRLSLREAFALANRLNVEAAIVLERGAVYRLERCGPFDAPVAEYNELVHTANKTLTVNGNAATIFQDCDGASVIVQQGGNELLNLVDFSLRGGRARHYPAGAVWNSGTGEVRVTNAVVADNQAISDEGGTLSAGGVASNGEVIISGATFAMNRSYRGSGGVAAAGPVKAIKSSFYDNTGAIAGAISGGAKAPESTQGPPPFTGRTPNGITLVYSTLTANSRPAVSVTSGGLTSFATVIAAAGSGRLCNLSQGTSLSLGSNYASGGTGCGFGSGKGDRSAGPDPKLRSGVGMKQAEVFVPGPGSPLLDAIDAQNCLPPQARALLPVYSGGTSDQLGVPRPQGESCDIGAVEFIHNGSLNREVKDPPASDLPAPELWLPAALGGESRGQVIRVGMTEDSVGNAKVSLRDAFAIANRSDRDTLIVLEPRKVYRLTRCVAPQTAVDNNSNDLIYAGTQALRVAGHGSAIVQTCDGSGVLALFSDSEVSLEGVTVAGGRSVIHPGGGIYMAGSGTLRLSSTWVTDNSTVAAGGGIASFGDVVLRNSTVSGNHSTEVGGGIIATADVTAVNSSLFDNTADLAIGAIGNHSGKLSLLFTTIAHNSAPNVAVGSIAAFGSIIADYLPPQLPPAGIPGGPPPGAPPPGAGGFPPPSNCAVEHPGSLLGGNFSTDSSCGFETVAADPKLAPGRKNAPSYLVPNQDSPALHLIPAAACAAYVGTLDQVGGLRRAGSACSSGAVELH